MVLILGKKYQREIPLEIRSEIFKKFADFEPIDAEKAFNAMRLVSSKLNNEIISTPASKEYIERNKSLLGLHKIIYNTAVPRGPLDARLIDEPLSAFDQVEIAEITLGSMPQSARKILFDKVTDLSNASSLRDEASLPLIGSPYITEEQRNKLVEDLTYSYNKNWKEYDILNNKYQNPALFQCASLHGLLIAHERGYLSEEQQKKLPPGTLGREKPYSDLPPSPKTMPLIEKMKALHSRPNGKQLDENAEILGAELASVIKQLESLGTPTDQNLIARHGEFEKLKVIAECVTQAQHDNANLYREGEHQTSLKARRGKPDERGRENSARGN